MIVTIVIIMTLFWVAYLMYIAEEEPGKKNQVQLMHTLKKHIKNKLAWQPPARFNIWFFLVCSILYIAGGLGFVIQGAVHYSISAVGAWLSMGSGFVAIACGLYLFKSIKRYRVKAEVQ